MARNVESAEREALKQAAEAFIASVQHWPKGGLQALNESVAKACPLSDIDCSANEKALRMLCIRCEVHSELPTPSEDEPMRREYQVQRLMQGMGSDALALEWIRVGAVSPAVYDNLLTRFVRCRSAKKRINSFT
jgi:hypothetical protein